MYFCGSYSIKYIARHFTDIKFLKYHMLLFTNGFKDLKLSNEWHIEEIIIKIAGKIYYTWTLLASETHYIID